MMKTVKTTICVKYAKPLYTGGSYFSGQTSCLKAVKVVAKLPVIDFTPTIGEIWNVEGQWEKHPKWGQQLIATKVDMQKPSGELLINFLSSHSAFAGVGEKRAKKLWELFNTDLYVHLENSDSKSIREKINLKDLPSPVLNSLLVGWKKYQREINNIKFLQYHGFSIKLAKQIMCWDYVVSSSVNSLEFAAKRLNEKLRKRLLSAVKKTAVERIIDNPYLMLAFCDWKIVDKFAKRLGIKNNDIRRRIAAVYAILYEAYKDGHTYVSHSSLVSELKTKIENSDSSINYENTITAALKRRIYSQQFQGQIVFQAFGPKHMEHIVKRQIKFLMNNQRQMSLLSLNNRDLELFISNYEKKHNIKLHENQKKAIIMVMTNDVSIITGGAGVGKTTVLKCIIEIMDNCYEHYIQMALAGRAAHQMRCATGRKAMTIAAFLQKIKKNKSILPSGTRLIIDEASMLDLPTTYQILKKFNSTTKLLLVGDPYQLPPVGPGLIFNRMVDSKVIPTIELTQVHRQDSNTGIPQIAKKIRNGYIVDFKRYKKPEKGVYIIECNPSDIGVQVRELYEDLGGFEKTEDVQILSAERGKYAGTQVMNSILKNVVKNGAKWVLDSNFFEGDVIMNTVNDNKREIWNGSLGKITTAFDSPIIKKTDGFKEKKIIAIAMFDGKKIELEENDFISKNIVHGFAVTIHKAQGSQFRRVIIPVIRNTRNLDLTMIYTALTRGIEQIVFVGEKRAISEAILKGAINHKRNVALSFGDIV